MKFNKIIAAAVCAAVVLTMNGCSVNVGTQDSSSTVSGTDTEETTGAIKLVTDGLSDDTVLARATSESVENKDALVITYGDVKKEYLYWLKANGITDDSNATYADNCKTERATIINYLMNEQILMQKAADMGLSTLTEEEQTAIEESYNSQVKEQVDYFAGIADYGTLETGESVSDEQKSTAGNAALDEYLADCGLTRDDLLMWQRSAAIITKVKDELTKDVSVERSEAQTQFDSYVDNVKSMYETDVSSYETGNYSAFWLPEGARRVKHILLKFDEAVTDEIKALRTNGDTDGADTLRTEKLADLQAKADDIMSQLAGGADFDELSTQYNEDPGAASYPDGYLIVPNGVSYMTEFQQGAYQMENIGDYILVATDYGYHIMQYAGDPTISDESITSYVDYIYDTLNSNAVNQKFSETLAGWKEEYAYDIDYAALQIDDPNAVTTAEAASTSASSAQ